LCSERECVHSLSPHHQFGMVTPSCVRAQEPTVDNS